MQEQQLLWLHRALPWKVQDFALVLEFHQVSVSLFLQVPLSGSPAFERFDTSSQFGVVCKCDRSALGCFFQVSDEDMGENRSQDSPCGTPLVTRQGVALLAELDCPEMIGKTRSKAQLGTGSCDLAPQMGKCDEHRRAGSTGEGGKCSCDSLQLC